MISPADIDATVKALVDASPDGEDLSSEQIILINLAVHASGTALDEAGAREWIEVALDSGLNAEQIQEVITLVSGLGVHAFFVSSRVLAELGEPVDGLGPLDDRRQALWDEHIAPKKYWRTMEEEIPGFLEALLRLSPDVFEAFLSYVGLPFRSHHIDLLTKELISMAADATPSHTYLPGMRMHLRNALRLGAGRTAIEHAIRIALAAPPMVGVR